MRSLHCSAVDSVAGINDNSDTHTTTDSLTDIIKAHVRNAHEPSETNIRFKIKYTIQLHCFHCCSTKVIVVVQQKEGERRKWRSPIQI